MIPFIAEIQLVSLLPAAITAGVAILIFMVNQWLLFVTKRSEVLREKLEKLWLSLLVVSRQTRPITAYGEKLDEEIARNLHERANLLIESLLEPTTFIALYFPQLNCKYRNVTKACGELAAIMRKPPIKQSERENLAATYVRMMKEPGFIKSLEDASEDAKKEVGDLQVYMRENQPVLVKTLAGMIQDRW